jgi:hypothetical protein
MTTNRHCGIGLLGRRRLSLGDYVTVRGPADGALVAGGCWCWLSYPLGPLALVLVKLYGCNGGLM